MKSSVEVVFRTDANASLGTGHLNRCMLLANYLRSHFGIESGFYLGDSDSKIDNRLRQDNIPFCRPDSISNPEQFIEDIKNHYPAIKLVVFDLDDPFYYQEDLQLSIQSKGIGLMHITINDSPYYYSKLVLNPNILALSQTYRCSDETRLLLGPRYFIFRDEFRNQHPSTGTFEAPFTILVSFGGADLLDFTGRMLNLLLQSKINLKKILVAVGSLNKHQEEIKSIAREHPHIELHIQATDMVGLMRQSDFLICSGGSIFWEAALMRKPAFVLAISEREIPALAYLDSHQYCISLGSLKRLKPESEIKELIIRHTKDRFNHLNLEQLSNTINPDGISLVAEKMMQVIRKFQ